MFLKYPNHFVSTSAITIHELPAGAYNWDMRNDGMNFFKVEMQIEIPEPFESQREVLNRINKFVDAGDDYARLGLSYKRGMILYGDPGCGKTAVMRMAAKRHIDNGGVVLFSGPQDELAEAIKLANNKVLVAIDDVDSWHEERLTHQLDGVTDVSNVLWLATTNFINQISGRLKRPGRFDDQIKMVPPQEEDVLIWVNSLPIPQEEKNWVIENSKGLSPAHVRELVIRINIFHERKPFKESK